MIVMQLNATLPERYVAGPLVHLGAEIEIDGATFEKTPRETVDVPGAVNWNLAAPSMVVETELLKIDDYEVQIFDRKHQRRLVAVIELVSPSNKDRPETRHVFTAKCASLLRKGVSVAIIDVVTSRTANLYAEMLELVG